MHDIDRENTLQTAINRRVMAALASLHAPAAWKRSQLTILAKSDFLSAIGPSLALCPPPLRRSIVICRLVRGPCLNRLEAWYMCSLVGQTAASELHSPEDGFIEYTPGIMQICILRTTYESCFGTLASTPSSTRCRFETDCHAGLGRCSSMTERRQRTTHQRARGAVLLSHMQ